MKVKKVLIEHCRQNRSKLPFDIDKRVTPYSSRGNELQVIRASVADHINYDDENEAAPLRFELQAHAMYPKSRISVDQNLKMSKLAGRFCFSYVDAGKIRNLHGSGFERSGNFF